MRPRRERIYSCQEALEMRLSQSVTLVSGVTLMQFMVQNIIGYPWASPLGRLGGLDPTMGHGSPGRPWDCPCKPGR